MKLPGAFLLLLLFALQATAQSWPARLIRIVVSQSPGGFSDVPVRLLAPRLSQGLGTPVFAIRPLACRPCSHKHESL